MSAQPAVVPASSSVGTSAQGHLFVCTALDTWFTEYAATFSAIVKDALMSMPDRLAPMLAAVDDEKAIHRLLAVDVTALLKKVNKAVTDSGL